MMYCHLYGFRKLKISIDDLSRFNFLFFSILTDEFCFVKVCYLVNSPLKSDNNAVLFKYFLKNF